MSTTNKEQRMASRYALGMGESRERGEREAVMMKAGDGGKTGSACSNDGCGLLSGYMGGLCGEME